MKGLLKTFIILLALIAIGVGASVVITIDLNSRVVVAREDGFKEGRDEGYREGWQEGHEAGYQSGSRVGYEKGNGGKNAVDGDGFYFIYNPAHDEVQEILAVAKADTAEEIHQYAESNGIRVAYVRCQLAREAAEGMVYVLHLVAFETADNGFVIIEPWSNREVKVTEGRSYSKLNGFDVPEYDDTITKVTVVW